MKQPPIFSRVSIRTVLLSLLLVFGGSSLIASLQRTGDSLHDYRENRIVAERSRIDAQLLTAGQHLAYERGRTAVVLSDAGQVSDKDRAFIDERRQLADAALDTALENVALANVDILPAELVSRLIEQRQQIRKLRSEVDRETGLSHALRDKQLAARWFDSASGFIDFIQHSVERLIGENRPGDKTTRLNLLAAAVLQQRMTAGSEAQVIAQALAAGHQPAALNLLYEMRGREDQLWLDIERLAAATGIDAVQRRVEEIKTQHLVLFRPLQDKALAGLFARGPIPVPLDKLTSASLPVLDGLSGLMMLVMEHAVNIATQGEVEARGSLIADIACSVFFLLLLMFALRYVLRYVIAPLEQVDRELRRLGALPEGNEKGNEIERIKVSAVTLERSIASLAKADQRMHLFFERQLVGMAITSPEKGWLKVNDKTCQMLGYSFEELQQRTWAELTCPDDLAADAAQFERLLSGEIDGYMLEKRFVRKNGSIVYTNLAIGCVRLSDGSVDYVLAMFEDITVRREMENSLHNSQRMYGEAQRIAHLGSWELNLADDALSWSDEIYRIFEINPQFGASYEAFMNAVHPDDRERVDRAYKASLENRELYEIEHRLLFPDGRIKYVYECCETYYDNNGKPLRSLGAVQDITERKLAERALDLARNRLHGVLQTIPDLVWVKDTEGVYLSCNPVFERFFGAKEAEIVGKTDYDFVDAELADFFRQKDREAIKANRICINEEWITFAEDQRRVLVEVRKVPLRDADGNVTGVLGISHDITDRKLMEKALIDSEQEFRSLAENLPDNIIRWDVEGRYLYLNPTHEHMLGVLAKDMIGNRIPDTHDRVKAGIAQIVSTEQPMLFVRQPVLVNGETQIHDVNLVSERDANGKVISVLGVGRDMTALYRLQDDLKAREQQLRALADSSPGMMGAFYARPDGSICMPYASPNIEAIFGLRPQDVVADAAPLLALTHPDDAQRIGESIAESARNMTILHEEYRILHPTKGERWMESNTKPEPHPDGGVVWYGYVHDITGRKRMEAEVTDARDFLSKIIDGIADPIFIKDRQHRWTLLNDAFCTFIGHPRGALLGKSDYDFFPEEQADEFWANDELVFNAGESNLNEESFTTATGEEHYIQTRKTPFVSIDGEPMLVGVIRDITERRRLSDELSRSKERYLQMFDNAQEGMYLIDVTEDRRFRIAEVNPAFAQQTGVPRDEMIGRFVEDILAPEAAQKALTVFNRALNTGSIYRDEQEYDTPIGLRTYQTTLALVREGADSIRRIVGLNSDITDLNRYQEAREAALTEAMRLAKTRSEFLAHMSHELRTPLNAILGYTQILQGDKSLGERNSDALNVIRQSGEHLLTLVEDILDLARIEAGRFKLDLSYISVVPFLHVVTDIIRIRAKQKGLEFTTDLAADLPLGILGDDKRLRQVMLNLLSNAVKFTDHGRVVLHVSRASPSHLAFAIQDTGIGIAANEMVTIFQPFEQSGDAQQRLGGSGLGLAISRELVRLMGGDIAVESRIGEGSVFSFELELPDVEIEPVAWLAASVDQGVDDSDDQLILPSVEEMQVLHKLAQLGNMRDIVLYAERIGGLAPRYQPFAARLRSMAENYQSKAILAFVEGNLHDTPN